MKNTLRFIGILFMGITAAVTLLGGVGTTCVALNPAGYESMKAIASLQWLYILYVLIGVALGILGIRATIQLVRGKAGAEKTALLVLVGGIVIGGIHMATSRALRGNSMPVDGVVYITVLTLIIFLIFRLPGVAALEIFKKEDNSSPDSAGGITAFSAGLLTLGVQFWAGPTHVLAGTNYADAFHNAMTFSGAGLILLGTVMIAWSFPLVRSLVSRQARVIRQIAD